MEISANFKLYINFTKYRLQTLPSHFNIRFVNDKNKRTGKESNENEEK